MKHCVRLICLHSDLAPVFWFWRALLRQQACEPFVLSHLQQLQYVNAAQTRCSMLYISCNKLERATTRPSSDSC